MVLELKQPCDLHERREKKLATARLVLPSLTNVTSEARRFFSPLAELLAPLGLLDPLHCAAALAIIAAFVLGMTAAREEQEKRGKGNL